MKHSQVYLLCALVLVTACRHDEYDISGGIDTEATLFTQEVSLPIADIGPITPKQLLGDVDLGETLGGLFKEDAQGYLVVEKEESIYNNPVLLLFMGLADPSQPSEVSVDDFSDTPSAAAESLSGIGLSSQMQDFSLYATNPFTEDISISGKLTLLSSGSEETSAEIITTQEFTDKVVPSQSQGATFYQSSLTGEKTIGTFQTSQVLLHLPASFLEKDPLGGWSSVVIGYRYKAYLGLESDFPNSLPIPVDNLDIPLGQYKVKEACIRAEVSNEIPVTLVLDSVDVMVNETDENGNVKSVVCEDVSVTTGITVSSGVSGTPAVSPLNIVIKSNKGTIPDIAGLQLNLSIKAPQGDGDKRLNMNQKVFINNIRVTVSGGITIQSL